MTRIKLIDKPFKNNTIGGSFTAVELLEEFKIKNDGRQFRLTLNKLENESLLVYLAEYTHNRMHETMIHGAILKRMEGPVLECIECGVEKHAIDFAKINKILKSGVCRECHKTACRETREIINESSRRVRSKLY